MVEREAGMLTYLLKNDRVTIWILFYEIKFRHTEYR